MGAVKHKRSCGLHVELGPSWMMGILACHSHSGQDQDEQAEWMQP